MFRFVYTSSVAAFVFATTLTSCTSSDYDLATSKRKESASNEMTSVKNPYGRSIFEMSSNDVDVSTSTLSSVNALLWQSALETVGFMGIKQADPGTGIIITEFYETRDEKTQLIITISSNRLASNSLMVSASRLNSNGTSPSTRFSAKIKDAILVKARDKKIQLLSE